MKRALLALEDFPTGWIQAEGLTSKLARAVLVKPPEPAGKKDNDDTFCSSLSTSLKERGGPEAPAEAAVFQAGSVGPFAFHDVVVFPDGGQAREAMEFVRMGLPQCQQFTATNGDDTFQGGFSAISFPTVGDETLAAKVTGKLNGVHLSGDFVIVRANRVTSTFFHFIIEGSFLGGSVLDSRLTEELVRKAEARQRKVE